MTWLIVTATAVLVGVIYLTVSVLGSFAKAIEAEELDMIY
jgi:hypothetical protein